jgi:hypothetical protein
VNLQKEIPRPVWLHQCEMNHVGNYGLVMTVTRDFSPPVSNFVRWLTFFYFVSTRVRVPTNWPLCAGPSPRLAVSPLTALTVASGLRAPNTSESWARRMTGRMLNMHPYPASPAHPVHREAELPRGARSGVGDGMVSMQGAGSCAGARGRKGGEGEGCVWERRPGGLKVAFGWRGDVRVFRELGRECVH